MASADCQDIVGGYAVVFPALPNATAILQPLYDALFSFKVDPRTALAEANAQINALFG